MDLKDDRIPIKPFITENKFPSDGSIYHGRKTYIGNNYAYFWIGVIYR
jgi:hypothetical protein